MNNRHQCTSTNGRGGNMVQGVLLALVLATGATGVQAAPGAQNWQRERLFYPTAQQLAHEQQGSVFIYDGLTDRDIQAAMDRQFDRVGSMMFVHTVSTREADTDVVGPPMPAPDDDDC
jgi:hypothetical protein